MSVTKYGEWLNRISYKPNVEMTIYSVGNTPVLEIVFFVPDVNDVKKTIPIVGRRTIDTVIDTFEHFVRWLEYTLRSREKHEFDEFFQIDGKRVSEPHAPEEDKRFY